MEEYNEKRIPEASGILRETIGAAAVSVAVSIERRRDAAEKTRKEIVWKNRMEGLDFALLQRKHKVHGNAHRHSPKHRVLTAEYMEAPLVRCGSGKQQG